MIGPRGIILAGVAPPCRGEGGVASANADPGATSGGPRQREGSMFSRMIVRRRWLAASVALGALGVASAAQAQPAADTAQPAVQPTDTAQPVTTVNQNEPPIVVTALRRLQTLIKVPQSVAVVSGETLERQSATTFL